MFCHAMSWRRSVAAPPAWRGWGVTSRCRASGGGLCLAAGFAAGAGRGSVAVTRASFGARGGTRCPCFARVSRVRACGAAGGRIAAARFARVIARARRLDAPRPSVPARVFFAAPAGRFLQKSRKAAPEAASLLSFYHTSPQVKPLGEQKVNTLGISHGWQVEPRAGSLGKASAAWASIDDRWYKKYPPGRQGMALGTRASGRLRGVEHPWEIPEPTDVLNVRTRDGGIVHVRRYGVPHGPRLLLTHGNGMAVDAYFPFWGGFDGPVRPLRPRSAQSRLEPGWPPRRPPDRQSGRRWRPGGGGHRAEFREQAPDRRVPFPLRTARPLAIHRGRNPVRRHRGVRLAARAARPDPQRPRKSRKTPGPNGAQEAQQLPESGSLYPAAGPDAGVQPAAGEGLRPDRANDAEGTGRRRIRTQMPAGIRSADVRGILFLVQHNRDEGRALPGKGDFGRSDDRPGPTSRERAWRNWSMWTTTSSRKPRICTR